MAPILKQLHPNIGCLKSFRQAQNRLPRYLTVLTSLQESDRNGKLQGRVEQATCFAILHESLGQDVTVGIIFAGQSDLTFTRKLGLLIGAKVS